MQGNRSGSFDRSGYAGQPPGPRGVEPHGHPYGYGNGPPASGGYGGPSHYARGGQPGAPIHPPYGGSPDRRFRDEPPRMDDRAKVTYPPGGYDQQYKDGPERAPYDHVPAIPPGPNPGDHYDGPSANMRVSSGGHYGQPQYEPPRRAADGEMNQVKQDLPYAPGPARDSKQDDIHPKHGVPPGHRYGDVYPPPNGPPPPASAIDHHGRRSSSSYQGPYPASNGGLEYDAESRWSSSEGGHQRPTHPDSNTRGRYGAYEGDSGGQERTLLPRPLSPNSAYEKARLQPQSHASVIAGEFSKGGPYRYEDRPATPPAEERSKPQNFESHGVPEQTSEAKNHVESNAVDSSRQLSDIAPSTEVPQQPPRAYPPRVESPSEIVSSQRDEVANMGCTCKKSKCLKLYCQCFAASVMCGPNCRCLVCHNTSRHAFVRKEAIRAILARNPQAFETKFKSTDRVAASSGRILAHKSGCKCRKSACLKKYCECYHAGVKCSGNCRCIGCRNMPPGGPGPGTRPEHSLAARSFAADVYSMKNSYGFYGKEKDAAQNLTFLKNGSPQRAEGRRGNLQETREYPSLPSLASSDTSPEQTEGAQASKSGDLHLKKEGKKPEAKVNSLLMAAYAMTELHSNSTSSAPEEKSSPGTVTTPEKVQSKKDKAQQYRSPKRKCDDDTVSTSSATPNSNKELATPEQPPSVTPEERQIKRGRFGSARKDNIRDEEQAETPKLLPSDDISGDKARSEQESTPEGTGSDAMTPLSARCIDFKHMDIIGDTERKVQMNLIGEVVAETGVNHEEKKTEGMDHVATSWKGQ